MAISNGTFTLQMDQYFHKTTKLGDICPVFFCVLKDQLNNIPATVMPSSIFTLDKKDVYVKGTYFNT